MLETACKSVQLSSQEMVIAKHVSPNIYLPIQVRPQSILENCHKKILHRNVYTLDI